LRGRVRASTGGRPSIYGQGLEDLGQKKIQVQANMTDSRLAVQIGEGIEEVSDELLISKRSEEDI
jgi:hypothetical protein